MGFPLENGSRLIRLALRLLCREIYKFGHGLMDVRARSWVVERRSAALGKG